MSTAIATPQNTGVIIAEDIERVLVSGDLSKLSPEQRVSYVNATCQSLGINPLTRPFEYVTLNGKLQLYAKKDAADQLRKINHVSIERLDHKIIADVLMVTAHAKLPNGRSDQATGAVNLKGLAGEGLANAYMKAETKAKRRVTLSICGLGFITEDELDDANRDANGNASFPRDNGPTGSRFDLESRPFEKPAQQPAASAEVATVEAEIVQEAVDTTGIPEGIAELVGGKWKNATDPGLLGDGVTLGSLKTIDLARARADMEAPLADALSASYIDEIRFRLSRRNISQDRLAEAAVEAKIPNIEFPADLWSFPEEYPVLLELAKSLR